MRIARRSSLYVVFLVAVVPLLILFGLRVYEKEVARRRTAEGYQVFLKFFSPRPKAPPFVLRNLRGERESLRDFAGKVVFLSFRTTW